MRQINKIYIHCSDSEWGDAAEIRKWHLARGFNDIGYHYVVCNSRHNPVGYYPSRDGEVQVGRPLEKIGAHVKGDNRNSIGICLIGKKNFTDKQMTSLFELLSMLKAQFNLDIVNVRGHYEYYTDRELKSPKTCPNLNMNELRHDYLQWSKYYNFNRFKKALKRISQKFMKRMGMEASIPI